MYNNVIKCRKGTEMKSIAEECIEYRALHGLTQKQFADNLGICRATLVYIENERRKPSKYTESLIRMYIRGERPQGTH